MYYFDDWRAYSIHARLTDIRVNLLIFVFRITSRAEAELMGRMVSINVDMAIFVTMNPGYAGRSNLPDNLKQLFRSFAMTRPDRHLIAQVCLHTVVCTYFPHLLIYCPLCCYSF